MDANDRVQMKERLEVFAARARSIAEHCDNEEQTKVSLINPYLELLGYDVRDPRTCRLEYTADIGKTGERVDYAIIQNGTPSTLIEAKAATVDIRSQTVPKQLQRYFMSERADFAALTNGLVWQWYRSTANDNWLEDTPFLVHDVCTPGSLERNWLLSICGPAYDSERALAQAEEERMNSAFIAWIETVRRRPDDEFLRFLIRSTKLGMANAARIKRARKGFVLTFNHYLDRETENLLDAARSRIKDDNKPDDTEPAPDPVRPEPDPSDEEALDLGDGRTIPSRGFRRAWRVASGEWKVTANARDVLIEISRHFARLDRRGPEGFYRESVSPRGIPYFPTRELIPTNRAKYYRQVDKSLNRWVYVEMSNRDIRGCIEHMCTTVHTPDGRPLTLGKDFEAWLPTWTRPLA